MSQSWVHLLVSGFWFQDLWLETLQFQVWHIGFLVGGSGTLGFLGLGPFH